MPFADDQRRAHPHVSLEILSKAGVELPYRMYAAQAPTNRLTFITIPSTGTGLRPVGEFPDPVAGMLHGLGRGPTAGWMAVLIR